MSAWSTAVSRSHMSEQPVRFLDSFARTLRELRQGVDVVGARRNLDDATVVAGEIEAIAAHRAATEGFSDRDPWRVAS